MSTNDDSASRRGRRPETGSQQRRPQNGQDHDDRRYQSSPRDRDGGADPYNDQRRRGDEPQQSDPRRNAYSQFSRHSYAPPPRQEAPPPQPQQHREPPRFFSEPAPRTYQDAGFPAYEQDAPNLPYAEADRDDLFGREPAPVAYGRDNGYEQPSGRQPATMREPVGRHEEMPFAPRESASPFDDYERNFAARIAAQESQAARFFLPEEPAPQRSLPTPAPDNGYMVHNGYQADPFETQESAPASYGREAYDAPAGWGNENHQHADEELHAGLPQRIAHGDELDEDFFADEDELYQEEDLAHPKRSRKKLLAAALIGAIGVGGGGAYLYKSMKSGAGRDDGPPVIHADNRPSKEMPSNPGGKQFANGEKLIYERLTPDGQTQTAALGGGDMGTAPVRNSNPSTPAAGNSLEDRIEEALKKAQRSGDAPNGSQASSNPSAAGRPDQPTVVRGETYRPDGTRVDGSRSTITPTVTNVNAGQLPPPFGNAVQVSGTPFTSQAQAATMPAASFRPVQQQQTASFKGAPPASSPQPTQQRVALATPAAPPVSGFYVQIKSSQDEKAAGREMTSLNDKYSVVLGGTQLITKTVDLGDKGVWFRTMAGPVSTREAATDLCTKLKGAGLSSCLIQKSD